MPVPIWVLKNKFQPRGIHLLRKKEKPKPPLRGFVPAGPDRAPWWDRMAFHHPGDDENSDVRAAMERYDEQRRRERAGWRVETKATTKGNLTGTEYQYWIGNPFEASPMATCRWCGKNTFSKIQRTQHLLDPEVLRENDSRKSCAKMLQESYKILSDASKHCIFCGKAAHKQRWGVWLCSKECEDAWKFNHTRKYPFGRRNPDILVL